MFNIHRGRGNMPRRRRLPRCVNCSFTVPNNMHTHSLDELSNSMLNVLRSWIAPTSIPDGGILCAECFMLLQEQATPDMVQEPNLGHQNVCLGCGRSIIRTRTYRVSRDCPERNVFLRRIPEHQIPRLERVCAACWRSANREVARQQQHDVNRHVEEDMNEDPEIPVPPPLPPQQQNHGGIQETPKITSALYRRAASSSNYCIFVGCQNPERLLVPKIIKDMLLLHQKIFVPQSARICRHHLNNGCWGDLTSNLRDFTSSQFDAILTMMERASRLSVDFHNVQNMPQYLCEYWLGMNPQQFEELLACVPSLEQEIRNSRLALCIYLIKLRTGDSNERLASLFQIPRSTLEKKMNLARNCLNQDFVPNNLGFDHISVEQVAARNRIIPEGLFGNPVLPDDIKPAIVMCDATYIYVQSSSNYLFQKNTYSLQKADNLVKPFMVVCCDGYILDCLGPFKATLNDAQITANDLNNEVGKLRSFFREDYIFILDRGFRDVVPQLEGHGFKAYMPESLLPGEHQLTTAQANRTRCVTMCRWVVEIVNGRIKRDYKLFRNVFNNRAATHLKVDFRIACSLINKFHPLVENPPEAHEYVNIAKSRLPLNNHLADFVEGQNINRRRAMFESIDSNNPLLNDFPRLEIQDLKKLALGTYQIKQAKSYFGEHIRENGSYMIQICSDEIEDDIPLILGQNNVLFRGRIKSRHVGGRNYYIYILISRDNIVANTIEAIKGYCCNCLSGRRTVGCCAHVMTVVWYLSWGRYNNVEAPASFLDSFFDLDE